MLHLESGAKFYEHFILYPCSSFCIIYITYIFSFVVKFHFQMDHIDKEENLALHFLITYILWF